jgi:hypothetical protein
LAVADWSLDDRAIFYLLVSGIYLLATAIYAAWQTHWLRAMDRAPWDARLMAYANLSVGGTIILTLGLVVLAVVAAITVVAGLAVLLLGGAVNAAER